MQGRARRRQINYRMPWRRSCSRYGVFATHFRFGLFASSAALLLEDNPPLIQKIIAERLSDKVQIMMVPMGKVFFANGVLRDNPVTLGSVPQK
jgi:hypothetical protein